MKRLYSSIILTLTLPSMLNAQQLPNAGFDNDWVNYYPWSTAYNSDKGPWEGTNKQGASPKPWCVSNVYAGTGFLAAGNKNDLGTAIDGGYNSSAKAVKLKNSTELMKQVIPAYISLGTTWSTSYLKTLSPNGKDGGTFGGINFTNRPDAITFAYKKNAPNEKSAVIAYIWKGTFRQKDVPANIASDQKSLRTCEMVNRDRNILDITTEQGGEITEKGTLIAKINTFIEQDIAEWTKFACDFEYVGNESPEMINVIIAAGDYLSANPKAESELIIDDVRLIYYSRLASLKVNGVSVDGFDSDKYEYTVDAEMPENSNAFVAECMGNSGSSTARIDLDKNNAKATITVTNANQGDGAVDEDGNASHVYTVQFNKTPDTPTGIDSIETDDSDTPAEYYNLQGTRVSRNSLVPGIYIRRQGTKTSKVVIQ